MYATYKLLHCSSQCTKCSTVEQLEVKNDYYATKVAMGSFDSPPQKANNPALIFATASYHISLREY